MTDSDTSSSSQASRDYERIEKVINYLAENTFHQPSLDELANYVSLSPHHFQKLFNRWAGLTPKQFLQTLTVEHAKALLDQSASVLDASMDAGLSSPARLHDHFVTLEAMTPGEYKKHGEGISIKYGLVETVFGRAFVAKTNRGICRLNFLQQESGENNYSELVEAVKADWKNATLVESHDAFSEISGGLFAKNANRSPIPLHIRGTNFQINVWRALLRIPEGSLSSYQAIANAIDKPKATRAVGTAIGSNPVGYLIPCHRVIRQSGALGGYRWGLARKKAMLVRETALR